MPLKRSILASLCFTALSACSVNPNPAFQNPNQSFHATQSFEWWRGLQDPFLDQIVHSGRVSGLDIRIAQTQIYESQAFTRAQFAQLLPSVDLAANSDLTETSTSSLGLQYNWQVDLFGSLRASVKAAQLRGYVSEALAEDVRRIITSQIVSTYIQLRARQVEIALSQRSAERLTESVDRITRLSNAGYATDLDVTRSKGQLIDVNARIQVLYGQERALQNVLRQIVGQQVDFNYLYNSRANENFVFPRPNIINPDPNRLFNDRPDIVAAALNLNAEGYERLSAQRNLYPSISFQGNVGFNGTLFTPFSFSRISSSLISGLVAPLLGRGQLLSQIDAETAQNVRAIAEYEQAVLQAVTEVDTALIQLRSNRAAAAEQNQALIAATAALEQSKRLFDAGEISYLDVLITEQGIIDAERNFILSEEAAALSWVQYMAALALK